jgi:sugar phosphate isomerase/epimerase
LKGAGPAVIAAKEFARATPGLNSSTSSETGPESRPRLLTGCCAYSYSKLLKISKMTMEDVIRKAVELGIDGVDMTGYWYKSTEPSYLASLRHLAQKNGVCFSGAATGASTVQADAGKRAQVLEEIKKWIDVTEALGAPHLRVFAGKLPPGATVQQGIQWTVETLKVACEYAGQKGITLGVENHEGITQNADVCIELVHKIDSPYFGINLDITNFIATPQADAYAQIEATVPYATHTHIRDLFQNKQAVDLDRVWQIFASANYKGFMSTEYEGEEDPSIGVPKLVDKVKTLCRKYSSV